MGTLCVSADLRIHEPEDLCSDCRDSKWIKMANRAQKRCDFSCVRSLDYLNGIYFWEILLHQSYYPFIYSYFSFSWNCIHKDFGKMGLLERSYLSVFFILHLIFSLHMWRVEMDMDNEHVSNALFMVSVQLCSSHPDLIGFLDIKRTIYSPMSSLCKTLLSQFRLPPFSSSSLSQQTYSSCSQHCCCYCVAKWSENCSWMRWWFCRCLHKASTMSHFVWNKISLYVPTERNQQPLQLSTRVQFWQKTGGLQLTVYRAYRDTNR